MKTHTTFVREASSALSVALGSIVLLALVGEARAALPTCSCEAHFEVVVEMRGADFKPDVPVDHFTALKDKGAFQTYNACRREARDQAHACMDNIYDNRGHPEDEPSQCGTHTGIRGDVPYNIIPRLERAACETGSPFAASYNGIVKVYRRTHGGNGCGPNLQSAQSVFVDHRTVDCLHIRNRESLGAVARTRVTGIDRPGSDLPGSGVTAGNGTADACEAVCNLRSGCKAWTWVPPGVQGPQSKCWLKGSVPKAQSAPGMVSGTRQHVSQ
jgi:hypothetical protein